LATVHATIERSGVDPRSVFVYDGEGSDPASGTPAGLVQWLTWADDQSWSDAYRAGLPDVNDDGKILSKSGTSARPESPPMPSLFVVSGEAGYIETASGRRLAVAVYATNGSYPTVAEGLAQGGPNVNEVLTQIQRSG
jgi:serine-type D-Ala-D-Ala carboxypeptidase/endopeptidase (penicillin-binding protein 4)